MAGMQGPLLLVLLAAAGVLAAGRPVIHDVGRPRLSRERLVFQTSYGDIHMAFYPDVRGARPLFCP